MSFEGNLCYCGSGKTYEECCNKYFSLLHISPRKIEESYLFEWFSKYSEPVKTTFIKKTKKYLYQISEYLDAIIGVYYEQGYPKSIVSDVYDEGFTGLKNSAINVLLGSTHCLAYGLFIPHGVLLRSFLEICFTIHIVTEDIKKMEQFEKGELSTKKVLHKIKKIMPEFITDFYYYLTANFAHCGPFHQALLMPRACYPENYTIMVGLNNLALSTLIYHITLELAYLNDISSPQFWIKEGPTYTETSSILDWQYLFYEDVVADFPPDEKKFYMKYSRKHVKPKMKKR
ncbi:SEC-C domain-containing protein [bacterium]|nr:SEC-C domain-containing protein [bacterium]